MKEKIWLSSPHMSDEGYELEYIKDAFEKNWIAPLGENVDGFENDIKEYSDVKGATALVSGTAAIHLALKLANIKPGDRVFCQSFTFAGTSNPIHYVGGVPVFIDSDMKSWNMDPSTLEEAFQKYPDTKAVLLVHLYGINADTDRIKEICDKYNAILIEDAAESLGSKYKGKASGTIGHYGIYSFNGNKIITTSGGGMLVSNDAEAVQKAMFWATQAREPELHYQHEEVGYNYRMSNIVAGIGRGQMKVLDQRVRKKKEIFETYKEGLKDIPEIEFMPVNDWDEPNYWLSSILINSDRITNLNVIEALAKENIESRPLWKPMHMQPVHEDLEFFGSGVSEHLFKNGLCLPSDTKMTKEQQDRVISVIRELWD